ncbi:unnamed protein product, partial [Lampetra fluviatilis]
VSTDTDRWSLVSFTNNSGRNIEMKFVQSLRRQFEFSVDSFQIDIDPLLHFYRQQQQLQLQQQQPQQYTNSVYGDFAEALGHLWERLIATRRPEEIRGGGLLKYCELLARGFRPHCAPRIKALERYMCSRFFIDFPDVGSQVASSPSSLSSSSSSSSSSSPATGPGATARLRYEFLMRLQAVVSESTVCLMGHERRQILNLIVLLAFRVLACHSGLPNAANFVLVHAQPAIMYHQSYPVWLSCS